ncbi:MAG: ATP-binding cassette domain-containing protein [Candidatus Hydrogenedens sp.]|nr:ATP-binding cassette domain-containing protein [Candidatus Hydrogenedens sp.]
MSLVRLEKVSKAFTGQPVLENVDLRIEQGERIGMVGRNGTGKSTIFRIITGEMEPDHGLVERMKKVRIASLAQIPRLDPETTIFEVVLHSFDEILQMEAQLAELEQKMTDGDMDVLTEYGHLQEEFMVRGGYDFRTRIKQVLHGLGFRADDFDLPFKALSGGQRTRLMLALVLLRDADLLLLDEPENHLDLEAREWLESYLQECRASVFVISHDRRTLNAVSTRILELERGEIRSFTGNYDRYVKDKALLREQQMKAFENQQEYLRKEQVYIDRFRYKATKARAVQSRIKRIEKIDLLEAPETERAAVSFGLGEVERSGQVVLDADKLSMGYGALKLYSKVSFQVTRGERLGIIGPNGAGKSTLLKQIAARHDGTGGEVKLGNKVKLGYYDQNHEDLNPDGDILSEVHAARPLWRPEQVRSFLGRFLFTGDDVFKKVSTLSGGELSRVAMARLILSETNLLLLDEPTNHLDIVSREALEQALSEFPGTLIMVSHDRQLLDNLVDKLIILEDGKAQMFRGNYSEYRERKRILEGEAEDEKRSEDVLKIRRKIEPNKPAAKDSGNTTKAARQLQKQQEEMEARIERLEGMVAEYDQKFLEADPTDFTKLNKMTAEYEAIKAELHETYEAWESLAT